MFLDGPRSRHIGNVSIITVEYMTLRYSVIDIKYNDFLNLEIERYSKVIIDCYNKKIVYLI